MVKKRGQALVESIVAISVLMVGFLGTLSLLSKSLSLNRTISDSYTANYLAAEGIEVMKNIIDHDAIAKAGDPSLAWDQDIPDGGGCYEISYDSFSLPIPLARGDCEPDVYFISNARVMRLTGNLYSYDDSGIPTPFKRIIKITHQVGTAEIKVNSVVNWRAAGGGEFEVNLEDHFMNWRFL